MYSSCCFELLHLWLVNDFYILSTVHNNDKEAWIQLATLYMVWQLLTFVFFRNPSLYYLYFQHYLPNASMTFKTHTSLASRLQLYSLTPCNNASQSASQYQKAAFCFEELVLLSPNDPYNHCRLAEVRACLYVVFSLCSTLAFMYPISILL